jgi:hypothetical protein
MVINGSLVQKLRVLNTNNKKIILQCTVLELKSGIIIQSSFSVSGTNCDKNWILFADSYSESEILAIIG